MTAVMEPAAGVDELDEHGELKRSIDPYDSRTTSANFDLDGYLAQFDPVLLATPEGRRVLCTYDPMLFAIIYMRKHLKNDEGEISFADAHFLWVRAARRWLGPSRGQREDRRAFVAPRSCGKALALDTPILTVDRGWVTHGELKVGDRVFNERGKPCNITAVSEVWQDRPCYELTFSDGSTIVADENHEWVVIDGGATLTLETRKLAEGVDPSWELPCTALTIVSVREVERQATSCISVDSPSHLYLAGRSLVPTHNSTWWFLILPMWAGAYLHTKFAAAFADSGGMAELHLATFKAEQASNTLLRSDFREFCEPARRHTGRTVADNQNMLHTRSGFTFVAKGIDSTSLGMKMGETRPTLIIFDDCEPPEATYSPFQRDKRLSTIENAILPLSELARVILVGTVTMPGSIVHELVRHSKGEEVEPWVDEQKIRTYHSRAIVTRPDGTRRSVWPKKWSLEYLESIEHTRSYKLNYDNDPKGRQGDYWQVEDIRYGNPKPTKLFIFVDPPVTQKTNSDDAGIAVVGFVPPNMGSTLTRADLEKHPREFLAEALLEREVADPNSHARLSRVVVLEAFGVKATGANLKKRVLEVLSRWPGVQAVILENNNGGDLWLEVFNDLPVKFITFGSHESKEVRFARALDFYQKRRVVHAGQFRDLEDQMTAFPKVAKIDICDATCSGVLRLLLPRPAKKNGTMRPR